MDRARVVVSSDFRQGVIVGALMVALLLAVVVSFSHAQYSLSVFGLSKHSKSGFCEVNKGLGLNYQLSNDWSLTAVRYKNSLCRDSTAAGAIYMPWHYGRFSFGTALLRVTGYQDKPIYAPIPVISYQGNGYAVDAIAVVTGTEGVIGLGVRVPF